MDKKIQKRHSCARQATKQQNPGNDIALPRSLNSPHTGAEAGPLY